MPLPPAPSPEDWLPLRTALVAGATYAVYHYGFSADAHRRRAGRAGPEVELAAARFQRLGGALCLGVVPVAFALLTGRAPAGLGLSAPDPLTSLVGVVVPAAILLPIVGLAARGEAHRRLYPEIRVDRWDARLRLHNAWTWAVYLLAYEVFFRGFLLDGWVEAFGAWPAIGAMTTAYVFSHLPKGAGEAFGCLLMGPVFGWLALSSGGIWAPWLLHLAIALTSDTVASRGAGRA